MTGCTYADKKLRLASVLLLLDIAPLSLRKPVSFNNTGVLGCDVYCVWWQLQQHTALQRASSTIVLTCQTHLEHADK